MALKSSGQAATQAKFSVVKTSKRHITNNGVQSSNANFTLFINFGSY